MGAAADVRASTLFPPRTRAPRGLLLRLRTRLRRPWLDGAIACGVERPGDRGLALRQAQLVDPRERRRLSRNFERVLTEKARPGVPTSAAPIDHDAVRVAKPVLIEIILSLLSVEAVEPRGLVLGWRLLTHPCSPLYMPHRRGAGALDRLWHESTLVLYALRPLYGVNAIVFCADGDRHLPAARSSALG